MSPSATTLGSIRLTREEALCADQKPLLATMETHGPALVRMLWRILRDADDVADAYQETFCRLAALLRDGKPWHSTGYIFRLASHVAIDALRTRRRAAHTTDATHLLSGRETDPADACTRTDDLARLQLAIAELPDHLRQVLLLREYADLDYTTIAATLNISAATARQYRHRAILTLTDSLRGPEGTNS